MIGNSYEVLGVDISETALSYVNTPKLRASATEIPLPDRSFDLVLSSEMLEHLTSSELALAISELKRLSKRYIIVSVPNQEQLEKLLVKCAVCHQTYHAYGHLHSFTADKLAAMFPEFKVIKTLQFGPSEPLYHRTLLRLRQRIAGQYFHPETPTNCPHCHSMEFVRRSNLLSKACNYLNPPHSRAYWLMMLLERRA
ncbi:MAG: SAM-dependent methyltransferase [Candidatus Cloacimonetes bacterium HGW-Cloacimonetes-1]|nr:MAG: SAM-dependent methyltransferase [Candidatus Cloacimonetes bacterium HGW-Cloacimonetes-1]